MRLSTSWTVAPAEEADEREDQSLEEPVRSAELELDDMAHADAEEITDNNNDSAEEPLLFSQRDYGSRSPSSPAWEEDGEQYNESPAGGRLSRHPDAGTWFIWTLTFSAGISGLLFGYDTGVISSTLVSVGSDLSNRELTTLDKSLVTSCTSLFALIASPLAGMLGDKLGRKPVILITDTLFVIGALWQAVTSNVGGMIVGRSLIGLAVGAASLVTPLYISELAPSDLRGRLVTILSLFITGGQVVAYVVGWLLSSLDSGWRWMVGLGAAPAAIQILIVLFLPETPRWLVKASRAPEARQILRRVYGNAKGNRLLVEQVLRGIEIEIDEEERETGQKANADPSASSSSPPQNWRSLFQIGCNRRALTIACLLQGLQQLCGFNSIMYYAATLFMIVGFSSPTLTSLSVAVTNFLFTLLAFALIDRIGRRRILLYSIPIMTFALVLCAGAFSTLDLPGLSPPSDDHASSNNDSNSKPISPAAPIAIVITLSIYTAAYACGIGTVPWQQSELFPLSVRAFGSALATATNWGSNFIIGLTFLPLMQWITPGWTFVLYAVVCVAGWIAVWAIYPEMSGLGLEDVRGLLADGWGVQESLSAFELRKRQL